MVTWCFFAPLDFYESFECFIFFGGEKWWILLGINDDDDDDDVHACMCVWL